MPPNRGPLTRVTALLAGAVLVLSGCGSDTAAAGDDSELRIGLNVADHNSWDPTQLQGGASAVFWTTVYDTLLQRAPDGSVRPGAAEEWDYNEDNTELTLTLREDMVFPDDTAVTSQAAAATMEATRDGTGADAGFLEAVDEIDTPDDRTLVLGLSEPDPALLYYLASSAGVIGHPGHLGTEGIATHPAGSGPYELDDDETTVGAEYVFTRNDQYWDAENYPYERVTIRTLPDGTARVNALRAGEIDSANLDSAMVEEVAGDGFVSRAQPLDWAGFMIVDREGEQVPALGDVRVRQAINLAFEGDAIVANLLSGHGTPTNQIFNADSDAYVTELEETYAYAPERALELMEEAGYGDGFEINLPSSSFTRIYEPMIATTLESIGIVVTYDNVPDDQIIAQLLGGEYPMFWMQHESQFAWYDLSRQVAPDAIWNVLGAEDEELNSLLEQVQHTVDEEEARALYQEIGTWLVDEAWFAPVLRPEQVIVTDTEIDVQVQVGFSDPFVRNYRPGD